MPTERELKKKTEKTQTNTRHKLTATERREEIKKKMIVRRQDKIDNLAFEFDVSRRTIERDLEWLESQIQIKRCQGKGGGVRVLDGYHPYRNSLSKEETEVLMGLIGRATDKERPVLKNIIREHAPWSMIKDNPNL